MAEPVHAALALLVTGGVPGKVIVHDRLEVLLKVDPFREAVRRDEDLRASLRSGHEFTHAGGSLVGRQLAGDDLDGDLGEGLAQGCGHVVGGLDEPAEDKRVVALRA